MPPKNAKNVPEFQEQLVNFQDVLDSRPVDPDVAKHVFDGLVTTGNRLVHAKELRLGSFVTELHGAALRAGSVEFEPPSEAVVGHFAVQVSLYGKLAESMSTKKSAPKPTAAAVDRTDGRKSF